MQSTPTKCTLGQDCFTTYTITKTKMNLMKRCYLSLWILFNKPQSCTSHFLSIIAMLQHKLRLHAQLILRYGHIKPPLPLPTALERSISQVAFLAAAAWLHKIV